MGYYIAYGSNLNVPQMGTRCPSARIVGMATLKDYRLLFKGHGGPAFLTIEKAPGFEVPVGVWKITEKDEAMLDRYEGFPRFYYKKNFLLECSDGKRHRCMAYIMHEDNRLGIPVNIYVETCLAGYKSFGFDKEYLLEALEHSMKRKGRTA